MQGCPSSPGSPSSACQSCKIAFSKGVR
jgi:hypothetical protein